MKRSFGFRVRYIAPICSLAVCLLLSAAYSVEPVQKHAATVFNFAYIGGDGAATGLMTAAVTNPDTVKQHADDLYTLINDGMAGSKYLSVVKFESGLSAVQRAIREQKFTEKDMLARIDTTPAGATKARKLGTLIGAEYALIGSVDKYVFRPEKGEVELTATIQMVDVSTGKVAEMFTATGRGARGGDAKGGDDEIAIGTAATYDAAEKLLTDIMKINPDQDQIGDSADGTAPVAAAAKPAKKDKSLVPAMLGALLIGLLASGG